MARLHRSRLRVSAIVIVALLAAACGSDDDGLPEGVRDIRDTDPAATDDDGETAGDPATDGTEEPDDSEDPNDSEEPADPGEQDPDPDADSGEIFDGVTVPDGALQINDAIDMPPDQQLEYLEFALDAFLYATRALNTGDWDAEGLASYYTGEELAAITQGLERYAREGLRQVNEGSRVEFMRVGGAEDGLVIVHQCTIDGPDDGVVDVETGEYTFKPDEPSWLLEVHLVKATAQAPQTALRIDWIGGAPDDVACP